MIFPESFTTRTLSAHPAGDAVSRILSAALNAVDPAEAVRNSLQCHGGKLFAEGFSADLAGYERIFLVGAGKAAAPMADATAGILGNRLTAGVVVTKHGHVGGVSLPASVRVFEAGHPVPDDAGVRGTHHVIDLLRKTTDNDLVICLISGGGSALLVAPAPGIDLGALQNLTSSLLASGADIHEINTIRKHLSLVKGGQLARLAHPAEVLTLILSDVIGDSLDIIASGPTVPDPGRFADAFAVLEKYRLTVPERIRQGTAGLLADTPKPGDPIFSRVRNLLIGTNRIAAEAARREAARLGFNTQIMTTSMTGEAAMQGAAFAARASTLPPKSVLIAGGETTVTIEGNHGLGGRNQEAALAAVSGLSGHPTGLMVTLATDGGDGPTDAAGAVISGETSVKAKSLGLDPNDFLQRHDAYRFFSSLGDLIICGPTQTNVNDLWLLVT